MRIRNLLFAVMLLGLSAPAAFATTIQYHVAFGARNFTSSPPGTEQSNLISGEFNIDLDVGSSLTTDNLSGLHSMSNTAANTSSNNPFPFQMDSPWSFLYETTNDILTVGGSAHGSGIISFSPAENDFYLQIQTFSSGTPLMWQLGFAQSRIPDTQFFNPAGGASADGYVFVTALGPVATAPLPAELPLFLTALGAMGVAGWRQQWAAGAA